MRGRGRLLPHSRQVHGTMPLKRSGSPLPRLKRRHVEAQGLLHHLHERHRLLCRGFIFTRPTRPNITTQNISCTSSISILVVSRVLLRDMPVRQAVRRLARGAHVKGVAHAQLLQDGYHRALALPAPVVEGVAKRLRCTSCSDPGVSPKTGAPRSTRSRFPPSLPRSRR